MAVQIPHRVYPEISPENALRGNQGASRGNIPHAGTSQGVLDRGGAHHARPRAYAAERASEAGGVQCRGLHQRQECNPRCTALPEARKKLRGQSLLGARLFRGYGRPRHGTDPAIHRRAGEGRSEARPVGDALDRRKNELKQAALSGSNHQAPGFAGGL